MQELTAAAILAETASVLRRTGWRAAAAIFILTSIWVALDIAAARAASDAGGLNLIASIANLVVQFWVTTGLLQDLGLRTSSGGGFGAMFGVGILTGLGILLGLVFLIVPGIVLGVRWSISVPYALADGYQGVSDAIGRSWQGTKGRAWPIFLALLPWYGLIVGGIFAQGFLEGTGANNMAGIVAFNLCVSLGVVAAWYAAVAIYVLVERPEGLSKVFA
jgi:hypothetical protein